MYASRCSVHVYTLHRVRFYEMTCMKRCILSLKQRTKLIKFEIIVMKQWKDVWKVARKVAKVGNKKQKVAKVCN